MRANGRIEWESRPRVGFRRDRGGGAWPIWIGVYSPPLDSKGNSVRGIQIFRELSERFGLHIFETGSAARRFGTSSRQYVVVSPDLDEQDNSFRSFAGNRFPWTLYELDLEVLRARVSPTRSSRLCEHAHASTRHFPSPLDYISGSPKSFA